MAILVEPSAPEVQEPQLDRKPAVVQPEPALLPVPPREYRVLVPAALEAVKQWRYRPYLLNGEPVEVETNITVTFNLAAG